MDNKKTCDECYKELEEIYKQKMEMLESYGWIVTDINIENSEVTAYHPYIIDGIVIDKSFDV